MSLFIASLSDGSIRKTLRAVIDVSNTARVSDSILKLILSQPSTNIRLSTQTIKQADDMESASRQASLKLQMQHTAPSIVHSASASNSQYAL